MLKFYTISETETRKLCANLQRYHEKRYSSQLARTLLQEHIETILNESRKLTPIYRAQEEPILYDLLQKDTIKKLFDVEKMMLLYGNDAGLSIFSVAINDFFMLGDATLLEMEKNQKLFFETFQNQYLLKYGEFLFTEIAVLFQNQGLPTQPKILDTGEGQLFSNTLYELYAYLYEDASDEKKRTIQSILQNQGISIEDLEKSSQI